MFVFTFSLLFFAPAWAEEVDDFTPPSKTPRNAAPSLDSATQALLDELVVVLNNHLSQCDDPKKYQWAIKKLAQNFTAIGNGLRAGQEIRELLERRKTQPDKTKKINRRIERIESTWLAEFPEQKRPWFAQLFSEIDYFGPRTNDDSIYKGLNFLTCCTSRININGIYLGLDKVDHFFGNGGLLFEKLLQMQPEDLPIAEKLRRLMEISVRQEHSLWGLKGLSPKSYGDLAANWQGVHFYRRLFDSTTPYLLCHNGQFRKNPKMVFHIAEFVDEAWNESTNCSSFINQKDLERFRSNLVSAGMTCPRERKLCDQLIRKHQHDPLFLQHAISPLCSRQEPTFSPIEKAELITWEEVGLSLRGFTWPIIKDLIVQKSSDVFGKIRSRL